MENKVFQNFILNKGLKRTKERLAVLKEIFSFRGHFEPEQLYLRIKDAGIKASRASVYRTLNLLVESGLVGRVARTEKGNVYEQTYGHEHHDHMICDKCGAIIEFCSQKIENLQDELCKKNNFEGTSHNLVIRGLCKKCKKTKR